MKNIEFLKRNGVDLNKSLELFGDIETYNDTLKGFNKSINAKIAELNKYLNDGDMPNYAIFVHSLKSDCKYFGFMKLANLAFEHEMASKDENIGFVREHFQELMDEVNKVKQIVGDYLGDNNVTNDVVEYEVLDEDFTSIVADSIDDNIVSQNIILVADDSDVVRSFVEKAFNDEYEIAFAGNGQEALKIIKENEAINRIKAILLDLNMPVLDGFAVLEYMNGANLLDKMPVTVISGDSSKEAVSRAFAYSIVDMITKPFNEKKIRDAVEKTVNHIN